MTILKMTCIGCKGKLMVYKLYLKKNWRGQFCLAKVCDNQCIERLIGKDSDVSELKFKLNVIQNIFLEGKKQRKNYANGCSTINSLKII